MKWKNLLPLIVILAVLVALVVVKQQMQKQKPTTIDQAVKLPSLLPEDLKPVDLAKLELYTGAKPDEKVILVRSAGDAEKWTVASHFDAPVNQTKIDEYLDMLVKLKGEFRATADDESVKLYDLADDKAFHVKGYKEDAAEPAFDLLVGKSEQATTFMRTAGSHDVLVEQKNPRGDAGIFGEDADKAPEPGPWLEKKVAEIDRTTITKLALTTPDKRIVFEEREKPASAEDTKEEAAEGENKDAPEEAKPEEKKEVQTEWVVAEGGPGVEFKKTALDSLLSAFNPLNATDIVDPGKKQEWGLEQPAFTCAITVKPEKEGEQPKDIIIEGGRPDPNGDGYIRIAGAPKDIVYKMASYSFERIFPKGGTLFDMPKMNLTETNIDRVEITQPEGNVVLVRAEDKWTLESPKAGFKAASPKIDPIARTLASLKASDYSEKADGTGLDAPTRSVRFTEGPDKAYAIPFGAPAKSSGGTYAKLPDSDLPIVVAKTDVDKIFVAPKDLYERTLLDLQEAEVASVTIEREADAFTLARRQGGDEGWDIVINGTGSPADLDAADSLVSAVVALQADDLLFGTNDLPGAAPAEPATPATPADANAPAPAAPAAPAAPVHATIRVKLTGGSEHVILIAPEKDGLYLVKVAGVDPIASVPSIDIAEVLPASESLKKQEPKPEEKPADVAAPAPEAPAPATQAQPAPAAPAPEAQPAPAAPSEEAPARAPEAQPAPAAPADAAAEQKPADAAAPAGAAVPATPADAPAPAAAEAAPAATEAPAASQPAEPAPAEQPKEEKAEQ